jgi:glycosyltransferase involved in cell wall biosynthesis
MEHAGAQTDAQEFAIVDRRYLLVIPIPCFVDDRGGLWLERMWHHDLVAHLTYLKDFVLCAPRLPRDLKPDLVQFQAPPGGRASFVPLPSQTSFLRALLHLPRTAAVLWREIGQADIVHSAVGGWPYPLGWIANPLALLRGKRLVIVVESPWRLGRRGLRHRLLDMDLVRHWMARWACQRAHLALFTHASYRDALCGKNRANAYVTPAVWVNEADILEDAAAEASWSDKLREPVRLLFAGRLVESKGVEVLLAALHTLERDGVEVVVDIIGEGERRNACLQAAASLRSVRLSVLEPVPYGRPFFDLVRRYHALLVPSLSDEQPRIVFDANSQAVSVIATDTDGLRPHVDHGRTGWLVPAGDVPALAEAIARASRAATELRAMGFAALRASRGVTHQAMHQRRSHLLRQHCT